MKAERSPGLDYTPSLLWTTLAGGVLTTWDLRVQRQRRVTQRVYEEARRGSGCHQPVTNSARYPVSVLESGLPRAVPTGFINLG